MIMCNVKGELLQRNLELSPAAFHPLASHCLDFLAEKIYSIMLIFSHSRQLFSVKKCFVRDGLGLESESVGDQVASPL